MPHRNFVLIRRDVTAATLLTEWQVSVPGNLMLYGDASHLEVQDALSACAALVVTSRREGLPTVVLEAMTHSKPIVVPDEAGCVEAIGGGEYGLIYEPGNLADLSEKTHQALNDPTLGRTGRERVLEEYDWRIIAPRLDAIYNGSDEQSNGVRDGVLRA